MWNTGTCLKGSLATLFLRTACCVGSFVWMASGKLSGQEGSEFGPARKLAAGVITIIKDPDVDDDATDGPREFSELLQVIQPPSWDPHFDPSSQTLLEKAKSTLFLHEIWSLEFGFKPLRVIQVGNRNVWYLVYFVRNSGEVRTPERQRDGSYTLKGSTKALRFVPTMILEAHDVQRAYFDRVDPTVVRMIAEKERVAGRLYSAAEIGRVAIPVSTTDDDRRVWGVATWEGVDPSADFLSVYVQGLTNAVKWSAPEGGYKPQANLDLEEVQSKTLRLNFWRSGDATDLHAGEIRYGLPLYPDDAARQSQVLQAYKLEKALDYTWVFR